jgi:hypothetical protein
LIILHRRYKNSIRRAVSSSSPLRMRMVTPSQFIGPAWLVLGLVGMILLRARSHRRAIALFLFWSFAINVALTPMMLTIALPIIWMHGFLFDHQCNYFLDFCGFFALSFVDGAAPIVPQLGSACAGAWSVGDISGSAL